MANSAGRINGAGSSMEGNSRGKNSHKEPPWVRGVL